MKKLFISQPMRGLTDEEILKVREEIRARAEKISQLIKINTLQNILTIAIEELAELTQVICKLKRLNNQDKTLRKEEQQIFEDLKEELSDVYLLLEQLKIITNINDYEIERRISEKIRRTFEKVGVSN